MRDDSCDSTVLSALRQCVSSQAVVACSGEDAVALVQLLEDTGLPPLCVALAREKDAQRELGEVLADAVKVPWGPAMHSPFSTLVSLNWQHRLL